MDDNYCGRSTAALEIKKALRRGPSGTLALCKSTPPIKLTANRAGTIVAKAARADYASYTRRLAKSIANGLAKAGAFRIDKAANGVGADATTAILEAQADGPQFETPDQAWLRKVSVPPQSRNAANTNEMADTGAGAFARQPTPDARTTQFGPPHSASISPRQALPTDDEDPTIKALRRIYEKGPQRLLG
jgi:hypothetical protein